MSSVTEELLGFVDLVTNMLTAQELYSKSRNEFDKRKWIKLKYEVEQVAREIHRDHRGTPAGDGTAQGMFKQYE